MQVRTHIKILDTPYFSDVILSTKFHKDHTQIAWEHMYAWCKLQAILNCVLRGITKLWYKWNAHNLWCVREREHYNKDFCLCLVDIYWLKFMELPTAQNKKWWRLKSVYNGIVQIIFDGIMQTKTEILATVLSLADNKETVRVLPLLQFSERDPWISMDNIASLLFIIRFWMERKQILKKSIQTNLIIRRICICIKKLVREKVHKEMDQYISLCICLCTMQI